MTKENQVLESLLKAFAATALTPKKFQNHHQMTCSQAFLELLRCQFYLDVESKWPCGPGPWNWAHWICKVGSWSSRFSGDLSLSKQNRRMKIERSKCRISGSRMEHVQFTPLYFQGKHLGFRWGFSRLNHPSSTLWWRIPLVSSLLF